MSPGLFRKEFAFEKWPDFDQELFDEIYNDDSQERDFEHHIYGYDIDPKAVAKAGLNVRAAGLAKIISVQLQDFKDFQKPAEPALMVTNPPYGERISTPNLLDTYKMIGERLKHSFSGNDAWILSYREECFEQIGLKPSIKIPLYNGSLECEFRKYSMFQGKMKDFRQEGGVVKTEEEKAAMAEKRRFKAHREFKKRLDEQEENEGADIRSFTFHSLERRHEEEERREAASRRRSDRAEFFQRQADGHGDDGRRRGGFKRDGERKPFGKQGGKGRGDFKGHGGKDFGGSRGPKKGFKKDFRKDNFDHDED